MTGLHLGGGQRGAATPLDGMHVLHIYVVFLGAHVYNVPRQGWSPDNIILNGDFI